MEGLIVDHDLKTWPEPFRAVWTRRKKFEIRVNDRGFKVPDCVRLREWDPATGLYSGRFVLAEITCIVSGEWGVVPPACVFGFEEILRRDESAERVLRGGSSVA